MYHTLTHTMEIYYERNSSLGCDGKETIVTLVQTFRFQPCMTVMPSYILSDEPRL